MRRPLLLTVAAAGLLTLAGAEFPLRSAASAQAPQDQAPRPTFTTEANYVRVEVYPTKDDMPVADLTKDDFEVFDNRTPQKIEQFERVVVRTRVPQDVRIEPNTVRESRAMVESPRARVFVLFLDTYHVDAADSNRIRKPLIDALDRMIGPDDLVGVMTPQMSANDVTFARKTTTIEGFLTRYWYWGERNRMNPLDPEDQNYAQCYPNQPVKVDKDCRDQNGIAAELIDRRHEKRTMDALNDLVRMLRGVREERKAIVAITDGWLLYRPNDQLMRPLNCQGPPPPTSVRVDPRSGRLTTSEPEGQVPARMCEADRLALAQFDGDRAFREILDEANRANASFYPVDPRGLTVFDTPIMRLDTFGSPAPIIRPEIDSAMLKARDTSLRRLAEDTDGLAILGSNDLARGFKRIVDDLSSYYLLGYYASGKLDGKFHSITVRVKRPGVSVRARRGYLAASEADVSRVSGSRGAVPALATAAAVEARAIAVAISPLEGFARPADLRLHAAAGWKPDNSAAIWMIGEVGAGSEWRTGADAELALTSASGEALASTRARIEPGTRGFRVALSSAQPLTAGDYIVRVRVRNTEAVLSATETIRVVLPAAPEATGAVFVRRGATTANRDVATSDLRFRRGEQLRIEVPAPSNGPVTARLLDRTGKPLNVPVATSVRDDADGTRWQLAQLNLAPLAPSDYVVELVETAAATPAATAGGEKRALFGFRVVP